MSRPSSPTALPVQSSSKNPVTGSRNSPGTPKGASYVARFSTRPCLKTVNTLKLSLASGKTLTGVMNSNEIVDVFENAIKFLGSFESDKNFEAVKRGIIAHAILTYGSERGMDNDTAETTMDFHFDTGVENVNVKDFIAAVFVRSAGDENVIRSFCRYFPADVFSELVTASSELKVRFGIVDPFVTFASLFPKGFSASHKYKSGYLAKVREGLDSHDQDL